MYRKRDDTSSEQKWQVEMVFIRFAAMARINFNFTARARKTFGFSLFFPPKRSVQFASVPTA